MMIATAKRSVFSLLAWAMFQPYWPARASQGKLTGHLGLVPKRALRSTPDSTQALRSLPSLYLAGHCVYNAEPYQTGPALVASLLAALNSVSRQHADGLAQLEVRCKRLEDIRLELARPFEHEVRLMSLLARQRELLAQLDLDKDEAGSAKVDAEEARQVA